MCHLYLKMTAEERLEIKSKFKLCSIFFKEMKTHSQDDTRTCLRNFRRAMNNEGGMLCSWEFCNERFECCIEHKSDNIQKSQTESRYKDNRLNRNGSFPDFEINLPPHAGNKG